MAKQKGQMNLLEYKERMVVWNREPETLDDLVGPMGMLNYNLENMQWIYADVFLKAQDLFGEEATQLLPDPSRTPKTLATWCHVAKSFPPATRVYDVPWTHYAEVVSLEPEKRAELLQQAETEGWTSSQLRRIVKPQGGKPEKICECPNCHAELKIEGSMLMIADKVVTIDDPEDEREAA